MGLQQLPAEIQLQTFSYLDNLSLKAARAVSRKLRDNASPALFRSVVACARYEALGAFQNISLNSILQSYVKEIVFDGSIYREQPALHLQVYEREAQKFEDLRQTSFWGSRTRWKRYKDLYVEQEDMKTTGVLLQSMARAIEWTTNLVSIVYSPHPHLLPTELKVTRDLLPRGHSLPDNNRGIFPLQDFTEKPEHPFRHLIGALYVAQYTGVRELRVEPLRAGETGTAFTFAIFDFPNTFGSRAGKHLFQRLERCELHFMSWILRAEIAENKTMINLSKMLVAATELRHLALHFTEAMTDQEAMEVLRSGSERSMISRLGLTETWPKLRSLSLGGVYMQAEQVLDLIRRHSYTMTSLSLSKCGLDAGFWADVVDEVLYSTRILPFNLDKVREMVVLTGEGLFQSTDGLEEWQYEGYLELSKDGERNFVDVNPDKKSVYLLRTV